VSYSFKTFPSRKVVSTPSNPRTLRNQRPLVLILEAWFPGIKNNGWKQTESKRPIRYLQAEKAILRLGVPFNNLMEVGMTDEKLQLIGIGQLGLRMSVLSVISRIKNKNN
jgi:hypothetical protein